MIPRIPGEKPRDLSRPLEEVRVRVEPMHAGKRLDVLLAEVLPWRSRTSVVRLIDEGYVSLARAQARAALRVCAGDIVHIRVPPRPEPTELVPEGVELPVLYQDRWMIAIDKPAGMAVHPAGRTLGGTLIHFLHARFRSDDPARDVVPRLLHRIDRETSGVVAVALDESFHSEVGRQFEEREVTKTYLAVVHGCPAPPSGTIDFGIGSDRRSRVRLKQQARRDGSGQPALTRYTVLRHNADYALVELSPKTGRTHQLRVHMSAIGHPIVGDKIYGPDEGIFLESLAGELSEASKARLVLDRHALHAHRLAFWHPFQDRELVIEAPLPADMAALV
jgi:23S rRNA pseudouridine1911/1915/1917 synthase